MSEERSADEAEALWPPFHPDLRLEADPRKGRSDEELEAIIREAARRRDKDEEPDPEKPT